MARYYIMASMSNVLQQKHQNMDIAAQIMESLQEMFGYQGTPVRDHMLALIARFNVAEVLGAEIQSEMQVDMALETLPEMFSQFKVSYNMNKLNISLTELMKELQNAEAILKTKSGETHAVSSYRPSSSKPKGK
ncbi:uncharacterized protein LOC111391458 [Olea europaea var. sylvestris]|uniref:uncharacterized protein LOC111391458 n=1 Tax=Olea europaea var. sylvestris TaxID=158386 RepID=UPI000C1D079D|nr:uncharacterized protein LOC111391458 [Olea europaea var. sylvestris]